MTKRDELVFLPLGGAGEIGMNLNAYGYGPPDRRQWVIVDLGVTFGDQTTPGVDVILPDPSYLESERENLLGIVLTHAHEDHIGAVGWLWPRLKAPIYATPFAAELVRQKLIEKGIDPEPILHIVPMKGEIALGPFALEFVTLTHSIPEPNGLIVRTPLGVVLHTGDWKIDPEPLIGETTDVETLRRLGDDGVLAMVCDSTNAIFEGEAGSEADVRRHLGDVICEQPGRVAVAAFASNVARLESALIAAQRAGRSVCLVGRSMFRITAAAKGVGLLQDAPAFIDVQEAAYLPADKVLYLCTGSQGEPNAALARIAAGAHPHVKLGEGDTVIFSSRVIPGNDIAIKTLQNRLADRGVHIITDRERDIHVSGHPYRNDLRQMYQWARPRIAIPVHGERRHLMEHCRLARELQVETAIAPRNGDMIRLAPGPAEVVDETPAGRLYVDGAVIVPADSTPMKDRRKMAFNGQVSVSLVLDEKGKLIAGPDIRARGLAESDGRSADESLDPVADAAESALAGMSQKDRRNPDAVEEAVARAVRRAVERRWGKKAIVDAMVLVV